MGGSQRCVISLIVPNAIGLHARPAAMLVKRVQEYDAEIVMECGRRRVNAKSILGILTLGAAQGAKVTVTAEGHDAHEAVLAVEDLFVSSFHAEESALEMGFRRTEEHTAGVGDQRYGVA